MVLIALKGRTSELEVLNTSIRPEPEWSESVGLLPQELPQERLLIADIAVAAAEASYEWTRKYVKERKAFKGTISDLQVCTPARTLTGKLFHAFRRVCARTHTPARSPVHTHSHTRTHYTL